MTAGKLSNNPSSYLKTQSDINLFQAKTISHVNNQPSGAQVHYSIKRASNENTGSHNFFSNLQKKPSLAKQTSTPLTARDQKQSAYNYQYFYPTQPLDNMG